MSIIVVFGGAVIIEGVVKFAIWLMEQMECWCNIAIQRFERKRRWDKSKRFA